MSKKPTSQVSSEVDDDNADVSEHTSGYLQNEDDDDKDVVLAKRETRAVFYLRLLVLLLLLVVALVVSLFVFYYTKTSQESDFEDAIADHANKIIDSFQSNAEQRIRAVEGFSTDITSHALHDNLTWPFVILPDFERRAVNICVLSDVVYIQLAILVSDADRVQYEQFSVDNQGWLIEGLSQQEEATGERLENQQENLDNLVTNDDLSIPAEIYKVEGLGPAPEFGPGPYLAYSQVSCEKEQTEIRRVFQFLYPTLLTIVLPSPTQTHTISRSVSESRWHLLSQLLHW